MTHARPADIEAKPTPRRGRPRVPGLEESRREAIIASAFAVLAEQGYHKTSMSDIARHAQIGQGTLYRYFSGKRELLDHVFDYAVQRTVDALDFGPETPDDYHEALKLIETVGSRLFALTDADPTLLRLITVQSSAVDAELRYRVVGLVSAIDTMLTPMFARLAPADVSDATDWAQLARMVVGMIGPGLVMSALGEKSPDRRTLFLQAAETIVDRGLLTPPPLDADGGETSTQPRRERLATMPAQDRGAQLYAAAVNLFLARGYHEVDVAHIVAAVGVSQGTFYNYFRNKRAVLDAVQRTVEAEFNAVLAGGAEPGTPSTRAEFIAEFDARIACAADYIVTNRALMEFVTLTGAGVDDEAFTLSLTGYQRAGALISQLLAQGRDRGWVRNDVDLEFAGQAVVATVVMVVLPVLLGEGADFDAAAAARACSAYLLSGLRGGSAPA